MIKVGLTGGIASGKSTVTNMIQAWDIPVIDADQISREVVEPGERGLERIVNTFGEHVLHEDGTLDRPALGEIIFNDDAKRKELNDIVHPEVRQRMNEHEEAYADNGEHALVLDIPLLIENGLTDGFDKVLLVYIPRQLQIERLMERDGRGEDDALSRIESQMPLSDKRPYADQTIDNSGDLTHTKQQLESIFRRWHILK
ncbi:dephospho-CoA kinase [Tuberibacillus sp. Marseille-P3662]|uniref:dephospho-CoA kinase n=1 Tax=Tuberibacillus sp. Marseille-P3662 TaxID=1965358 RepID=UPI000A1CB0A1|nr:dephospho-CoA kinase [Tuberibacillus sp. Marseille-P3662]